MATTIYVAVVEGSQDEGYSAFFPDLPGCVTAAETMLELPAAARDALSLHLAGMIEDGETLPEPTPLEMIARDPDVAEVGRLLVDVDVEDAPVRVNISVGAQFLKRVDVAAEARGMTRSGFLVEAARKVLAEREPTVSIVGIGDTSAAFADYLGASGQRLTERDDVTVVNPSEGWGLVVASNYPRHSPYQSRLDGPSKSALGGVLQLGATEWVDRSRINLSEEYEVRDWAVRLGVSADRLREAVEDLSHRSEGVHRVRR